jgi:osmoprotectant transport system ATP-binding protein
MTIAFDNVSKVYANGLKAVDGLTLDIAEGETLVLLGTSGSGKTTTMRMLNRLIDPSAGRITIDGRDVMATDPVELRRGIGYAIQHIGLFPHMTIAQNIAVVPELLGWDRDRIAARVDALLHLVGLDEAACRERYPHQLSGGQCQRVGVARALAADPPLVLMDEPFGALDPITREQIQTEFLDLESEIRKTVVFVTHDVFEAVKMGDRVAILHAGRLQQVDTPRALVEHPANAFVDGFLGQHRFQLSLLTRPIASLIDPQPGPGAPVPAGPVLHRRDSLIAALDAFKGSGSAVLPVVRRQCVIGRLEKKRLLNEITRVLGELEAAA